MQRALLTALVLTTSACSGTDIGMFGANSASLIDGTPASDRPEIGYLGGCTATLIRPNVVVSASHCHGYSSRRSPGSYGSFSIERDGRWIGEYDIDLIEVYGQQLGSNDVALLHLSSSVPDAVSTPTRVADRSAEPGEESVLWGYGCTSRGRQSGGGQKRSFT